MAFTGIPGIGDRSSENQMIFLFSVHPVYQSIDVLGTFIHRFVSQFVCTILNIMQCVFIFVSNF
jgi:hypothetical protein